jgi:FAD/FMN-containing dehydrogenase
MLTRRDLLLKTAQLGAVIALPSCTNTRQAGDSHGVLVNDAQSHLNPTRVQRIVQPKSLDNIQHALHNAQRQGRFISVAGGRHSMGGQQFGRDTILIDMKKFNRVVRFDKRKGHIEVEGGIQWPELIDYLHHEQREHRTAWAIREKQTGVDRVTLAGSLSSNIHGRGLRFPPIIGDIESFVLMDAKGEAHTCSRRENPELFSLAIGGYGLFGIILQITLRLAPRTKLERVVEVIAVKDLIPRVSERILQGFVYGDCQYSTDLETDAQLHAGVFSCYRPVDRMHQFPSIRNNYPRRTGSNFIS